MLKVREAFDRHAGVYEDVFSAADIRGEVWEIADPLFSPRMKLLDLGCGTGEDAVHFAERGVDVTAIDISTTMLSKLGAKANRNIRYEPVDMRSYSSSVVLDGVLSNFGALNCVADLDWLARLPIVTGGHAVLTFMGRFYPLEFMTFLLKGNARGAFRRSKMFGTAVVEGVSFPVYYHSFRSIRRALDPKFELIQVRGLRSIAPAPHLKHLRRFRAVRLLESLDRRLCSHPLTATYADHYVSVWRRREA